MASIEVDMVAFPGIRLTDPTEAEIEDATSKGMATKFFQVRLLNGYIKKRPHMHSELTLGARP